jgi:hypothetical protein
MNEFDKCGSLDPSLDGFMNVRPIEITPSYDVCISAGNISIVLELAQIPDPSVFLALLRLEKALFGAAEEQEPSLEGISLSKNYFFLLSGVFDIDLCVTRFVQFFTSLGMKVRTRSGLMHIEELECQHFLRATDPQPILFKLPED